MGGKKRKVPSANELRPATESLTSMASAHEAQGGGGGKKRKKRKRPRSEAVAPAAAARGFPSKAMKPSPFSASGAATVSRSVADSKGSSSSSGGGGAGKALSKLQLGMKRKLEGAQFRMINEHLYTSDSGSAFRKFREEPHLFDVYHRGFREQVDKWPVHPLDAIIAWVKQRPGVVVADFGCGEARLAASVPNKVHSFDLVAGNERITACDMARVPLPDASVDVAVFCLALMNTNLADFVREARRVLKPGGVLKVAEVRSRFEGEGGGGVEAFKVFMADAGFDQTRLDASSTMFFAMDFTRSGRQSRAGAAFTAKACVYKKR